MTCKHRYAKLNDHQVFCRRCGDMRSAPYTYSWYPHWRPYTIPYPTWPYVTWSWTGTNTTTTGYVDTAATDWGSTVSNLTNNWIEPVTKDAKPETPKSPGDKKIKGTADPDVKK